MKNILKFALLISAITLIAVGCRKDSDSSLINTWEIQRLELKEITFASGVDAIQQAAVRASLPMLINEFINPELVGITLEFRENGNLITTDQSGDIFTGSYTVSGNILTITEGFYAASGRFSISGNTLHWDIDPTDIFLEEGFGDIMGISSLVFRFVLRRV